MILHDLAAPILRSTSGLSDALRGGLWDAFHDSKSAEELAQKLANVPIADSLKRQLLLARAKSLVPDSTTPIVDAAIEAMHRVAQLPQNVRSTAERHPVIAKFLVGINSKS